MMERDRQKHVIRESLRHSRAFFRRRVEHDAARIREYDHLLGDGGGEEVKTTPAPYPRELELEIGRLRDERRALEAELDHHKDSLQSLRKHLREELDARTGLERELAKTKAQRPTDPGDERKMVALREANEALSREVQALRAEKDVLLGDMKRLERMNEVLKQRRPVLSGDADAKGGDVIQDRPPK